MGQNCDQVRRKLRAFVNNGEMKLGELHKALRVSGRSFNAFLAQSGKFTGMNNATYPAAYRFFKQREAQGIKVTAKRVKKSEEKTEDYSGIQLPGEETASVPVFDSCDEIRKKINAHLRQPGITRAAYLRDAAKTYPDGRNVQASSLSTFLSKKGASAGNTSAVFYSSYVFFEKKRIKEGKPKSKHRLEMEKRNPGGFDTSRVGGGPVWAMKGERPYEDAYGEIHFAGRAF